MKKIVLLIDIISSVFLLLFFYTAISKLMHYPEFRLAMAESSMLKPFAGVIAWLLPVAEIVTAVLLFFPATRIKGLYVSFFLIVIFTVYLSFMILFTHDIPCNCGGAIKNLTWPQHIYFNLFFLALAITGILLHKKDRQIVKSVPP